MPTQQYRVRVPLRAVNATLNRSIITIPAGATLSIIQRLADRRFVAARWGQQDLLVFEQDLLDRAVPQSYVAADLQW
jgi:hypothetical protein